MSVKLYVGNLPWGTQRDDLNELFSRFGTVEDTFIPLDRESGRPRGFAFVTMADAAGSDAAINSLNETEFQGRTIRVNEAQPPGERRGGGGGGGYGRGNGGGFGGGGFQQRGGYGGGGGFGGGYNQGYGGDAGGYGQQRQQGQQGYGNQGYGGGYGGGY